MRKWKLCGHPVLGNCFDSLEINVLTFEGQWGIFSQQVHMEGLLRSGTTLQVAYLSYGRDKQDVVLYSRKGLPVEWCKQTRFQNSLVPAVRVWTGAAGSLESDSGRSGGGGGRLGGFAVLGHPQWGGKRCPAKAGLGGGLSRVPVTFLPGKNRVSAGIATEGGFGCTPVVKSKQTKVARSSPCAPHPYPERLVLGSEPPLQAHRRWPAQTPRSTGLEKEGAARPSARGPRGLVTPVPTPPPPSPTQPSPAQPWVRPLRPAPLLSRGASLSRSASLWAASGRARPGRAEGGEEGGEERREGRRGGRGGGRKARESALRAAPLPRACQQRVLGGSGPNRARRLASSVSAASRLRGSPGLSEVPARRSVSALRCAARLQPRSPPRGKVAAGERALALASNPAPQSRAATKDREDERRRQSREGEHPERGQPSGGGGTEGDWLGGAGRTGRGWGE
jgi:hypothetical protein